MDTFRRGDLVFDVSDSGPSDGEVVVLLHGFPQNRHAWDTVTPILVDAGYRVLAPDQRGYSPGARPAGRKAYVAAELVADVVALIDAAGADRVHLVGHDWGALVTWAMASAHPERLRTANPISVPHPGAFAWSMPRGQLLRSWYMGLFQLPALPELLLPSSAGVRMLTQHGLTDEQVRGYLDALGRDGLRAALNWYRAIPFSRDPKYTHRSTVSTMYVWSDADVALGRAGAEATERYVTGPYRFEVLKGVSHWIPENEPGPLARLLLDHFGSPEVPLT
jgi:pimeloyl-ACP methyl ester carboxylesterase